MRKHKSRTMLVFIDDSGDPGFKLDKGSSHFFVISAVLFDDNLEAEKTAVAIKELRRELKFGDDVEFKFNKSKRLVREKFLSAVNSYSFKIRCIVIEKEIIYSDELRRNKKRFYALQCTYTIGRYGGWRYSPFVQ